MNSFDCSGKGWAMLVGVIADSDYVIEVLAEKFIDRLRSVMGDVDVEFTHRTNRLGTNKGGYGARARNLKAISGHRPQQPFGHLTARRVAGAEKENTLLLTHFELLCGPRHQPPRQKDSRT